MSWQLVSLAAAPPQPWRNGGGVTRELLAWPAAASWRVRISVAEVQAAGPFSAFPGIERWFAVLDGNGVALRVDGQERRLRPADAPCRFDGASAVEGAPLAGPTRDLNLMAPPGCARMRRVAGELAAAATAPALLALYAHAQPAEVLLGGEACTVPAFHLAWRLLTAPASGVVRGAPAFWMEIDT